MNRGLLLFVAGLLSGLAGAALFRLAPGGEQPAEGAGEADEVLRSGGPGAAGVEPGKAPARRPAKGGQKAGATKSPAGEDEILDYLASLARVEDLEELNFMALIRNASLVAGMSEGEVDALLRSLREGRQEDNPQSGEMVQVFEAVLLARLAELNGPEAMRRIVQGEVGEDWAGDEDDLAAIALSAWVEADAGGAAAWFSRAAADDAKLRKLIQDDDVQTAFFAAMARADATRAHALIEELGAEAGDGIEAVARHEPTTEGLEHLLAATEGEGRVEVLREMSERDPELARNWLDEQSAGGEGHEALVRVVVFALMERDPAEGATYFMEQDLPEERHASRYADIIGEWAQVDAEEARAWLSEQPDTTVRDEAERALATELSRQRDYEGAFQWVAGVADETVRQATVRRIMREGWMERERQMSPALSEAARAAGYDAELAEYVGSRQE